ncbi:MULTISPECIES: hypothetical protein [unclassified Microbacterium]
MSNTPENGQTPAEDDAPLGGSDATEAGLEADNEVEEDMLRALNPNDAPA